MLIQGEGLTDAIGLLNKLLFTMLCLQCQVQVLQFAVAIWFEASIGIVMYVSASMCTASLMSLPSETV